MVGGCYSDSLCWRQVFWSLCAAGSASRWFVGVSPIWSYCELNLKYRNKLDPSAIEFWLPQYRHPEGEKTLFSKNEEFELLIGDAICCFDPRDSGEV